MIMSDLIAHNKTYTDTDTVTVIGHISRVNSPKLQAQLQLAWLSWTILSCFSQTCSLPCRFMSHHLTRSITGISLELLVGTSSAMQSLGATFPLNNRYTSFSLPQFRLSVSLFSSPFMHMSQYVKVQPTLLPPHPTTCFDALTSAYCHSHTDS